MAEWFTALCSGTYGRGLKPPPIHDLQVHGSKKPGYHAVIQSAGVTSEGNLRVTQATKHANKGSILVLKPRADVTRSPKQAYQWSMRSFNVHSSPVVTDLNLPNTRGRLFSAETNRDFSVLVFLTFTSFRFQLAASGLTPINMNVTTVQQQLQQQQQQQQVVQQQQTTTQQLQKVLSSGNQK